MPRWARREHTIWAAVGAGLLVVYLMALRLPAYGVFLDDGVYLVTAKAIAEGGGYHIVSTPGEPPQTKYPILFPSLLAVVWRIWPRFPANLIVLKLVPFCAALVWWWFSYRLLRMLGSSPRLAVAIVALTAASGWVIFVSTALMSETLFAALVTAGLCRLSQINQPRGAVITGLLFGLACLTRTAGIVPAGVAGLIVLSGRNWGASVAYATALSVCLVPWVVWVVLSNPAAESADVYSSATAYAQWHILTPGPWAVKREVLIRNAFAIGAAPQILWSGDWPVPLTLLGIGATWLLMARGVWLTRWLPVTWIAVAYGAMMLVWIWPPARFVVPLIPVFLWIFVQGLPTRLAVGILIIVTVSSSAQLVGLMREAQAERTFWPTPGQADDWTQMAALFDWIRRETPPEAVVAVISIQWCS